jgi:transposase
MQAYSLELRARVVRAYEKGDNTSAEIAARFSVGQTFLKKMLRQQRETGSLERLPQRAGAKRGLSMPHRKWLARQIKDQPDTTLAELQERLSKEQQVSVSPATVCRELQELGLPRKKSR